LGRRGAAQASFTNPEIRELGKLEGVDVIVDPQNIELDPASLVAIEDDRTAKANLECLHAYAARMQHTAPRRITLRFLASPVEIVGVNGRMTAVKIEHNELVVDSNGGLRSKGTGKFEIIEASLVLRSIGYRSVPIESVPFDPATSTGLIGNNKPDAAATVEAMLTDLPMLQGISDDHHDLSRIEAFLRERGIDYVTYQDWKILDQYEVARGARQGCPRVKVTTVPEMMAIIRQGR
jgi:ferredoxin/flavodoxin---NADP+ reductase